MDTRTAAWNAVMTAVPGEQKLEIPAAAIEGRLPPELAGGRHLQNGPGWTRIGERLAHPFDGHGFVRALEFTDDGGVRFRSRYVETPAFLAERTAGRLVYKGLGTNVSDSPLRNLRAAGMRNVSNTTIQPWAGRLISGWEGGRPYALDAETLATLGEETFNGALPDAAFLAHMRIDTAADRLIGCNVYRESPSRFVFREFDASGNEVAEREVRIPGMHFEHDFVVTPRWYVLAGNPMKASLPKFAKAMLGMGSLIEALHTDASKPGELYLVPRGRPGPVRTVRLPQRAFVIHFANAYDLDDATCVVEMCAFESFEFGEEFGFQGPRRPLDPELPDRRPSFQRLYRATVRDDRDAAEWEQLSDYGMDFPRVHPAREGRAAPAIYAAARSDRVKSDPFDALARVDTVDRARPTDVWCAPEGQFVGEPVFAPRPGASELDDGWVVAVVYDGVSLASRFCVFEASALSNGPVAVVPLPLQPYGFHGFWEGAAA
ncbi:MAG: carotenoid oxygenase family protein [Pseudomonadales bacterium]|nr:carotenoid oxygenase family protein [Pseudomonadales bacterium]